MRPCRTQRPDLSDYADSYTLRGCSGASGPVFCGVFARAEARCATGSGARCPGGASAAGNADPTLCDNAPVYQNAHGQVLLRKSEGGGTRWYVSGGDALVDCEFHNPRSFLDPGCIECDEIDDTEYPRGGFMSGRLGYPPTGPAYGQMRNDYCDSISVVVGGGR